MEWTPISELPKPGARFGKYWVMVEGEKYHSGTTWLRQNAGLARTENDGFYQSDIFRIAEEGDMDLLSPVVTHFMAITLPPYPSPA